MKEVLSNLITNVAKENGINESLRVIKSNRPDLCDYQCDEVFKLVKIYHKSPKDIGEELVSYINRIENFDEYFASKAAMEPKVKKEN